VRPAGGPCASMRLGANFDCPRSLERLIETVAAEADSREFKAILRRAGRSTPKFGRTYWSQKEIKGPRTMPGPLAASSAVAHSRNSRRPEPSAQTRSEHRDLPTTGLARRPIDHRTRPQNYRVSLLLYRPRGDPSRSGNTVNRALVRHKQKPVDPESVGSHPSHGVDSGVRAYIPNDRMVA